MGASRFFEANHLNEQRGLFENEPNVNDHGNNTNHEDDDLEPKNQLTVKDTPPNEMTASRFLPRAGS